MFKEQVMTSNLTASQKTSAIQRGLNDMALSAANSMAQNKDLAGMSALLESPAYQDLTVEQQRYLSRNVQALGQEVYNEEMQFLTNRMIAGEVNFDNVKAEAIEMSQSMPGMTDAQKEDFEQANLGNLSISYVEGLIRRDQFDTAMKVLKTSEMQELIPPQQYATLTGMAQTGIKQAGTIKLTGLTNRVRNELASRAAGRAPDETLDIELEELSKNTSLSDTQQESISQMRGRLDVWSEYSDTRRQFPSANDADLAGVVSGLQQRLEDYDGDNFAEYAQAQKALTNDAALHIKQRTDDLSTYISIHDPASNKSWNAVKEMVSNVASANTPEERLLYAEQAAINYTVFNRNRDAAVAVYGSQPAPNTMPVDGQFAASLAAGLNSLDPAGQVATMGLMKTIFQEDAYDVGAQMTKADPGTGTAILFDLFNQGVDRDISLRGKQRLREFEKQIKVNPTDFTDPNKNRGIDIPITSLGQYSDVALQAMYVYAVGIASQDELFTSGEGGGFTEETILAARNAVLGEPFRINSYSEAALPYRKKDTGEWVDSREIERAFKTIRVVPSAYTGPPAYYTDGTEASVSQALMFATPVLVGEGMYRLDIPASSGYGTAGFLENADGTPFVLDVRNVDYDEWRLHKKRSLTIRPRG
jgi:hypothetical protein